MLRADLFWAKVDKNGGVPAHLPDLRECWLWTASLFVGGYGRFGAQRAHRVSWELHHGEVPEGLFVLHRCDNPRCVNPGHLFLGTQTDNMRDMWAKRRGRRPRGADVAVAKLDAEKVRALRAWNAALGKSWAHVK
jgi:hypothetical protein